ncbi:MarR family winged helix-turn-helix transcriptional regulator [Fusibacter sp. JL298sf-3]
MTTDDKLKLDNQLCFPMYKAAKEIITKYGELLEPLDLTYTQYLVMMVLWEFETIDMKTLGDKLSLDSSTLTPLLNRLIEKEYLSKTRDEKDRRLVIVQIEPKGMAIKKSALLIPDQIYKKVALTPEEAENLRSILDKVVEKLSSSKSKK